MSLAEQQLVVRFVGGVETKEDRKGVLPTKLLALENAVFTKVVSTAKRYGYEDLGDAVLGTAELAPPALALGRRGKELLAFSADQVHSLMGEADAWVPAGDLRSVMTSMETVAKTGTNQTMAECCVSGGVALYAWEDSAGGVWYALLDDATGRVLTPPTQAEVGGSMPRCIALGSFLFVVYALVPARELRLLRFQVGEPTLAPVETSIVTDLSPTVPGFDLTPHGDHAVLAWARDNSRVGVAYLHSSGELGGTGLGLPVPVSLSTVITGPVSLCSDGDDRIAVVWAGETLPPPTLPDDGAEWASTFPTITVPTGLWPMQDSGSPAVDTIGAVDLDTFGSAIGKVTFGLTGDPLSRLSVLLGLTSDPAQRAAHLRANPGTADFDLNATVNLTGLVRFKFTQTPATDQFLMRKKAVSATGVGWAVQTNTSGHLSIVVDSTSSTAVSATIAVDHNDGAFHWIMWVVNRTAQTVTIWSDLGTATASISAHAGGTFSNTQIFGLGDTQGNLTACARGEYSYAAAWLDVVLDEDDFDLISTVVSPVAAIGDPGIYHATLDASSFVEIHGPRALDDDNDIVQLTCAFDGQESDAGDATLWALWQRDAAAAQDHYVEAVRTDIDATTLTLHETWTQRGCGLASKAWQHDGDAYVHFGRDSTLYRTYYAARVSDRLVVARLLPGLGNGHLASAHLPSVLFNGDDEEWYWPAIYVTDVDSPDANIFSESGLKKVELAFDSDAAFRSVEIGATTYIAGGLLHAYDGQRVVEAEFHYGIDDVEQPALGAPAGAGLADGTYGYVFVLENVLANGEIQRGPASTPVMVVVTGGPRRVTFLAPTYRLTAMPNARIAVYRSLNGDASIYSRVTSWDPSTAGQANGHLANDTTVDVVSFVDEMPDGVLQAQDPLYTNGGIPSNRPLAGARLIAAGKGRVFVVDGNDIYYSQERAGGYALETTPALKIEVEANGGDVAGIVVMDESVVILKERALYHVTGPGPLPNPDLGGGWSPPELISSDVGCVSPDSICQTPAGILFQSRKGIYLLGRDFQVSYIGAPVEAYNAQIVAAATLVDDRTQIRLVTPSGSTLLYDYERDQWSTFTNHEGRDAIIVDSAYHYLRNDGRVWRETTGYADGNAHIRQVVETAWVNLSGHKQGLDRLWWVTILGEFKSAHTLRVYVAFDYQDGWTGPPIDIDPSEGRDGGLYGEGPYGEGPYGGGADTRYQFQIHIGQECEAVRFRFEDVEAEADYGASFDLTELHLTGGVERSSYTVEESRRY